MVRKRAVLLMQWHVVQCRNGWVRAKKLPEVAHNFFFFQAEDGIRDYKVTGVQTCALPIFAECFARESQCERLELTSGEHRHDAHRFYLALGFALRSARFVKTLARAGECPTPDRKSVV